MQLRLDAADRLVELVEERRGPVPADEAARALFAIRSAPVALARSLLEETIRADARLAWRGDLVSLARAHGDGLPLEAARFVVVDLETTGLTPSTAQICEIGAVRIDGLLQTGAFRCPYCGGAETRLENIFGPTPCRSLRYCESCKQPFEQFKTI